MGLPKELIMGFEVLNKMREILSGLHDSQLESIILNFQQLMLAFTRKLPGSHHDPFSL